jgi:hypothetical protein
MPEKFSFPAARRLAKYLGQSDAMLELTELACRFFVSSAEDSENLNGFVETAADRHGVCVNLGEFALWRKHLSQSYIITVYESAERFFREFRAEHIALFAKEWSGDAHSKDPLTLCLENVSDSVECSSEFVGDDLVSRFQYYRLLRNWIVHGKQRSPDKETVHYRNLPPYSPLNIKALGRLTAPNKPNQINFDDFILFSRVTKLIADRLCAISAPPQNHWESAFDIKPFQHLRNNSKRFRNAVIGKLRTDYGMDDETSKWISKNICDSLA